MEQRRSGPRTRALGYGMSPFGRLAATHAAMVAGDVFLTVALSDSLFFSVTAGQARPKVLLYLALTMAPFAVVAPVVGPFLDRIRGGRSLLIVGIGVVQWFVCLWMAGRLDGLFLYPAAFGMLVLGKSYSVAKSATVPSVVSRSEDLVKANSRLSIIGVVGGAAAGLLALGVLQTVGAPWVLRLGAFVYLTGGLLALRIPRTRISSTTPDPREAEELNMPSVRIAGTGMALLRAAVGFTVFLFAFALKREGEPAWFFGATVAVSGVGAFLGAVIAPLLRRRLQEEYILVGSILLPALVMLLSARNASRLGVLSSALALSLGAAGGKLAFDSILQRDAPDAARGRTFARFETRFQLMWVAGALVPVALLELIGLRLGLFLLAVVLGAAGLSYVAALRSGRARTPPLRPPPDETPAP